MKQRFKKVSLLIIALSFILVGCGQNNNSNEFWSKIVIIDTGCGISKRYLNKIFDPFFTTKVKGIGLGLSIVYRIIESYKGTILVKSESGEGSQFTIYLPSILHHQNPSIQID